MRGVFRTAASAVISLALLMTGVSPAAARDASTGAGGSTSGPDATLYEVTENMAFDQGAQLRSATAALQGKARVGSPLCPQVLISALITAGLISGASDCVITAQGSDEVDAATGFGRLWGTFAVVIQGDNPIDAAEFVVMTGTFEGTMQGLADASFNPLPLIAITSGVFVPQTLLGYPAAAFGIGPANFDGIFRLPFAPSKGGPSAASYLLEGGKTIAVDKAEHSLAVPTVRVEIKFRR